MMSFADPGMFGAFVQVIVIDLVLAGDNAVVIGLAAAALEPSMRRKAIFYGIIAATVLRIVLAVATTQLLAMTGLLLAGGLLLLWVCWKMWQELRNHDYHGASDFKALDGKEPRQDGDRGGAGAGAGGAKTRNFRQAVTYILVADVSMSLDNVLAVAGAAREYPLILAFGLMLSVAMMGLTASLIARLLARYYWIAYVGLAVVLFVALRMVFHGAEEVLEQFFSSAMAAAGSG